MIQSKIDHVNNSDIYNGWVIKLDNNGDEIWNNIRLATSQQSTQYTNLDVDAQGKALLNLQLIN